MRDIIKSILVLRYKLWHIVFHRKLYHSSSHHLSNIYSLSLFHFLKKSCVVKIRIHDNITCLILINTTRTCVACSARTGVDSITGCWSTSCLLTFVFDWLVEVLSNAFFSLLLFESWEAVFVLFCEEVLSLHVVDAFELSFFAAVCLLTVYDLL